MSSYGAVLSNDCEDGYQVGEEPILKYNSDSKDVRGNYFFTNFIKTSKNPTQR